MGDYDTNTDKDRAYRDEQILRRLYFDEGLSVGDIAKACDCDDTTVYRWMGKFGIDTDSNKPYRNEDTLRNLYHEKRLSLAEVAKECDCTVSTIVRWMDKFGIGRRNRSESHISDKRLLDEEWLREKYHGEMMSITDISELLGLSRMPVYRALERFDIETHSRGYKVETIHPGFMLHNQGYEIAYAHYYDENGNQRQDRLRLHRLLAVSEHGFDTVCDMEVHHKNNVPWDNRPDNLELMSKVEHATHHFEGRGGLQPWQG